MSGLAYLERQSTPDPLADFRVALEAAGLTPGEILADGMIHRCGTADHPRSQNGWYVLHPDPYAGAFGDWATGTSEKWSCGGSFSDTDRERLRVEIDRQRAERESRLSEIQSAAAQRAREYLSGLKPATALNGYLINKGVKPCPGLLALDNQLVVPVLSPDDNQPMSFQTIIPFRKPKEKLFLSGGRVKGGFFPIKGKDGPLLICEGIATGLSLNQATGLTVLVAFSTTNLANVAMMASEQCPKRQLVLCGDNDQKPGKPNAGLLAAQAAAKAVDGVLAVPDQAGDWNDVFVAKGADAVRAGIEDALERFAIQNEASVNSNEKTDASTPLFTPDETRIDALILNAPPELEYVFEGIMPRGVVGALIGMGGVSKSYFQIAEGIGAATGRTVLKKLTPPRPMKVLALFAEETRGEFHRRVHQTVKTLFPDMDDETQCLLFENFHAISVAGKIKPLMRLKNNNPERTEHFDRLRKTLDQYKDLDFLILDPKSRFYGLDENNNDHNTAWVSCLEEIVQERNITIQFSHHVSKASNGALNQVSARGGSALVDACRWVGNLRTMDEATAKRFEIDDYRHFVEFDVSKNNYAPPLGQSIFFRRGEHGILFPVSLEFQALKDRADLLCSLIQSEADQGRKYTRNELVFKPAGKELRDAMECKRQELTSALDFALREGWIQSVELSEAGTAGRPKGLLYVKRVVG